ncbi:MAG: peptidylprolyl isomerase [Chitinivibrionales bacterium]|nr:peptidylprolyl isomerase [Chitinivibrionales bacterium]
MEQAQAGSRVRVVYMGKLKDGTVFDTNQMSELLEFTVGSNELLPGFENAVIGMTIGEKRVVTLPPDQGYGERDESMIGEVPREKLPDDAKVEPGATMTMHSGGQEAEVKVLEVKDDTVKIDAKHPLAGEELTYEIELVEIVS